MAERSATSGAGPSRKDKGKAKVGIEYQDLRISEDDDDDDQETQSAFQESPDNRSALVLPFKKRWAHEVEDTTVGTPQEKSSTDQPSDTRQEDDENAPDDQTETDLKPGSRAVTANEYCLSKTLGRYEVIPHNPLLYLDVEDTSYLLDWPQMVDFLPVSFSVALLVFDGYDRRYNMLLKQEVGGGRIKYAISRGYFRKPMDRPPCFRRNKSTQDDALRKLLYGSSSVEDKEKGLEKIEPKVDRNQVESGRIEDDQVPVEKNQQESAKVEDDQVPVEKNQQESAKDEGDQVPVENTSDQTERKVQGPGSRVLTSEEYCMEKTLTTYEVIEDAKLYLDAYEASELTAFPEIVNYPPGTYSKTLLVYDKDDRRYDMQLKHHISRGTIGYAINSGWNSFIRTHDLEAGDVVTFYRVQDESVSDDYYHVIRYTRKSVGRNETREKIIDDGQKNPKTRYKAEARRKEDGSLVIKLAGG
ncbi:uncharacterized protein LOC110012568 isoform X2 [Sesamum indicum]|uniref:Uncharacterized protein LOC110012568 isoform X2 n=1 Tax=Sesamum indicum TaxID=4182 RepID=A0A8M8UZC5_SESIN|nr:uncharacterized protein LOC110012568 isoform X2 [Sesamum indicum]